MTRWARPNPACEHNGGLMMWVRLMGGYHWQHCPLAGHRTPGTKHRAVTGRLSRSAGHLPLHGNTRGGENTHTILSAQTHVLWIHVNSWTLLGQETGRLVVELGQLRLPWLSSIEQTLCVCVSVSCSLITPWCSSFTLNVIDTPVWAEWTLTHGSLSTVAYTLLLMHCYVPITVTFEGSLEILPWSHSAEVKTCSTFDCLEMKSKLRASESSCSGRF